MASKARFTVHLAGLLILLVGLGSCSSDTSSKGSAASSRNEVIDYIEKTYPDDPGLRKVLIKRLDIFDSISKDPSQAHFILPAFEKSRRCVWFLRPDDAMEINAQIEQRYFNKPNLYRVYGKFNATLSGELLEVTFPQEKDCSND